MAHPYPPQLRGTARRLLLAAAIAMFSYLVASLVNTPVLSQPTFPAYSRAPVIVVVEPEAPGTPGAAAGNAAPPEFRPAASDDPTRRRL